MNRRENALEVINNTGRAEYLPVIGKDILSKAAFPVFDRPRNSKNGYDWFGCYWLFDRNTGGFVQDPKIPPRITDITEWKNQLSLPSLETTEWEEAAKEDLSGFDRNEQALIIMTESGIFERLHHLIGFQNALLSMYEEPEAFKGLINALLEWRIGVFEKIVKYYRPDAVLVMDDVGGQTGPLMSLDMYREMIKPYDERLIAEIHRTGTKAIYHSCGKIETFIGDFIDMGADIINPLQGGINDLAAIEAEHGERAVFYGGLSGRMNYTSTTEAELRTEVDDLMDIFWEKKNLIIPVRAYVPGNGAIIADEAEKYNMRHRG